MVYLLILISILFLHEIECAQPQHINEWQIERKGEGFETETLFDCNVMGMLCSEKNCAEFADTLKTLPTENIYNNKGELKDKIHPVVFGDYKLLCVSNNFFRVAQTMSGIVRNGGGSLDYVELRPGRDDGRWSVEIVKTKTNMVIEKEKEELAERGYQLSKHIPCDQARTICNKNLRSCIQNNIYPYLTVDVYKAKFNQLAKCDDRGNIEGSQCSQVLCTEKGGSDDDAKGKDINNGLTAIIQCETGNVAHLIHYHISEDRWCLSKYEINEFNQDQDQNSMTLMQMLSKQVVDKNKIAFILEHEYDPFVQSFWFFGDAVDAIENKLARNEYKKVQEKGLLDWKLTFGNLNKDLKEIYKRFRQCQFNVPDDEINKNINCKSKTVTPWDLLQIAINEGTLASALTQTINVPKNSAVKADKIVNEEINKAEGKNVKRNRKTGPMKADDDVEKEQENKSNNYLTLKILAIFIPIVLITMSGIYIFYI